MPHTPKHWRYFVLLLSLLVFLLTLHAKLSAYDRPASVTAVSSSKLWLNGQKMEAETQIAANPAVAIWSIAFLFLAVLLQRYPAFQSFFRIPPPVLSQAFEPQSFLRPPPIF
jgi:hypothetical protein